MSSPLLKVRSPGLVRGTSLRRLSYLRTVQDQYEKSDSDHFGPLRTERPQVTKVVTQIQTSLAGRGRAIRAHKVARLLATFAGVSMNSTKRMIAREILTASCSGCGVCSVESLR